MTSGQEKIHKTFFIAALLAVAGGAVLELPDQSLTASLHGIVLLQLSNAAFAFGQIAYKRWMASRPAFRDAHVFGLMYFGAVVVAGAFSLATTDYRTLHLERASGAGVAVPGHHRIGDLFLLVECRGTQGARRDACGHE